MAMDEKLLEEKIREYRVFKSCAESTLMALCECGGHTISQSEMCKLACGFAGGIGGTFDEGTCGAVTGALIANGLLVNSEVEIKANAREIFNSFKNEYGTVRCDIISKNGEDKSPCVDCCVYIAKIVAELI